MTANVAAVVSTTFTAMPTKGTRHAMVRRIAAYVGVAEITVAAKADTAQFFTDRTELRRDASFIPDLPQALFVTEQSLGVGKEGFREATMSTNRALDLPWRVRAAVAVVLKKALRQLGQVTMDGKMSARLPEESQGRARGPSR